MADFCTTPGTVAVGTEAGEDWRRWPGLAGTVGIELLAADSGAGEAGGLGLGDTPITGSVPLVAVGGTSGGLELGDDPISGIVPPVAVGDGDSGLEMAGET